MSTGLITSKFFSHFLAQHLKIMKNDDFNYSKSIWCVLRVPIPHPMVFFKNSKNDSRFQAFFSSKKIDKF